MQRALAFLACAGWLAGGTPAAPAEGLDPAPAAAPAATEPAPAEPAQSGGPDGARAAPDRRELLLAFRDDLDALRSGDDDAARTLLRTAEILEREHDRPDVLDVALFYAALPTEERVRGHALQARYREEFLRVRDAERRGTGETTWPELRADVLSALAEVVASAGRDPAPAAYALGLRAELLVRRAEACTPDEASLTRELAEGALAEAARASELFASVGMLTPDLEPIWVRAVAARLLGRLGESRREFERCLQTAERVGIDSYRERALLGLIRLAREVGDVQKLERLLDELSALVSPAESWELTREYASLLLNQDHPDAAADLLERYPPTGSAGRDAERNDWSHLAGSAALRAGDLATARACFDRLLDGPLARIAEAHLALAEGATERIVRELAPTLTPAAFGTHELAEGRSIVGDALLRLGRPAEAIEALEASLELTERWRARHVGDAAGSATALAGDSGENTIGERLGVHTVALLAEALTANGRPLEAARAIEEYQSRGLRQDADDRALAAEDVVAWAAHAELGLVTWVVGPDSTVVAAVGPDGVALSRPLARGRAEIREAVRRLREAARHGTSSELHALGAEIADELLPAELRGRIAAAKPGERLLLLLHGPLEDLPASALVVGDRWLDERVTPLVLPGLPAARPGEAPEGARGDALAWTLLGGRLAPAAGSDAARTGTPALPELPGAAAELDALAAMHPGARRLEGERATLAAALETLRGDGALHAATHLSRGCAHAASRLAPLGLALANGEVLCSHLVAETGPELPLVVLSACESGGGEFVDAEGLLGLARAFLEAGTRDLVVTLWPVEDGAAMRFALRFHAERADGATPSEAARRARAALRIEGAPAADWAAYRVLGRD